MHSEITKESGTLEIQEDVGNKYLQQTKDGSKYESGFKSGKEVIERRNTNQRTSRRPVGSPYRNTHAGFSLTIPQREAIKHFYEVFYSLATERKNKFQKLETISGESGHDKKDYVPTKTSAEVSQSLSRISGNSPLVNLYQGKSNTKKELDLGGWKDFESSPFSTFFTEEEGKSKMHEIDLSQARYDNYVNSKALRCLMDGMCPEKKGLKIAIESKKDSAAIDIADKLLKYINQST